MDINSIRRKNLAALVKKYGSLTELAIKIDTDRNYLSQILSDKIKSNMGDTVARRIEISLGEERGWMDMSHDDDSQDIFSIESKIKMIPLVNWQQAKQGQLLFRELKGEKRAGLRHVPFSGNVSESTFALEVQNNLSISPSDRIIYNGDIIIIDTNVAPRNRHFVLASVNDKTHDEAILRQYIENGGVHYLLADNSLLSFKILKEKQISIIGVVIAIVANLISF